MLSRKEPLHAKLLRELDVSAQLRLPQTWHDSSFAIGWVIAALVPGDGLGSREFVHVRHAVSAVSEPMLHRLPSSATTRTPTVCSG